VSPLALQSQKVELTTPEVEHVGFYYGSFPMANLGFDIGEYFDLGFSYQVPYYT
jgi:hypothetical protein